MTAVSVTADHIAMGDRENCETCPVALAIAETFADLTYVSVDPGGLIAATGLPGREIFVDLPREVQEFIWDFDDGDPVEPFTFELDYPAVTR